MKKTVSVIGGGISGLAAAVFLSELDYKVTIFEASPKFGGRVYSFFDKTSGMRIDNGQHILAGWYKNTFEYLHKIGTYDKLFFQNSLEVNFRDSEGNRFLLKTPELTPPFNLAAGIMRYNALGLKDKLAIVRLVNKIKKKKFTESELKSINTDKLFVIAGQSEKAVKFFWNPFIIAVFNAEPQNTSAFMFAEMIITGFINKGGSSLVIPEVFLSDIFIEPAIDYLKSKNSEIFCNKRAAGFRFNNNNVTSLLFEDNSEYKTDLYISAVPFFEIKKLLGEKIYSTYYDGLNYLSHSPIVNIHLRFDKDINNIISSSFSGLLNTNSQWVFKINNNQVCIVISSAYSVSEMSKEDISVLAEKELKLCFPELKDYKVSASRVIKEMRATFVPDKDSLNKRPGSRTAFDNLFLAGDWTDTGLPATIEGAVKSSKNCVNEIIRIQ